MDIYTRTLLLRSSSSMDCWISFMYLVISHFAKVGECSHPTCIGVAKVHECSHPKCIWVAKGS